MIRSHMNFNKISKNAPITPTLCSFALQLAYPINVYAEDESANAAVLSIGDVVLNRINSNGIGFIIT